MRISDLKPNKRNPRKINDQKLGMLKDSLVELGDISGVCFNIRDKKLFGGHQRTKLLPEDSEIVLERRYDPPTRTGTVAEGYVEFEGEKINFRMVDWDEEKAKLASVAANKAARD